MKSLISQVCTKPRILTALPQRPVWNTRRGSVIQCSRHDQETAEEALRRRLRESQQVEQRVVELQSMTDFQTKVLNSEDSLVVLEVSSDVVCDTGVEEEPELQWRQDRKQQEEDLDALCNQIKHVFQRTARECRDARFYAIDCDTDNGSMLCDQLQIDTIPTLQFYRRGKLLWEHRGALHLQEDLGEGVLYYANTYAGGADASDHVVQIKTVEDFYSFIEEEENDKELKVVDVSIERAEPCIKIYPAVVALAKNFKGYVSFARLLVDDPNLVPLAKELNILDVPTFLFYKKGKEVERNASSSRADLIGQILQVQGVLGLPPPPPPSSKGRTSRRIKQQH